MPASNSDRLAALRSGVSTSPQQAQTVYLPKPVTTLTYTQRLAALAQQSQAQAPAAQAQAQAQPAAQAAPKRTWSTYHCCCCATDFKEDTTDCPDPRPSPLGDRCPSCTAAGKQRPFEAAGMTLSKMMDAIAVCRFCQGNHWAMNCPTHKK